MVETYRALRRLEIGGGVFREFGDMVPEAESWAHTTRAVYLRSGFIERAYVPEAEYEAFMANQKQREEVPEPEVDPDALTVTEPVSSETTATENPEAIEEIVEEEIEDLGEPEPVAEEEPGKRRIVKKRG